MALYTTWLVLAGLLFDRPIAEPALAADLMASIEATVEHKDLKELTVGLAVGCADDKSPISGKHANTPMNPASGTKLLTSAAALSTFAPDHRLETRFYGERDAEGSVAKDLVIVATGDPSLQRKSIGELAKEIAAAGVRSVKGRVIVDVSAFSDDDLPPAFDQKHTDAAYRPNVPPFGVDDGALRVTVSPAKKVGEAPRITLSPVSPSIHVDNDAKTVEGKGIGDLQIATAAGPKGTTRVIVSGKIGLKAAAQGVRRRMHDPAVFALEALAAGLKKAGVSVAKGVTLSKNGGRQLGPELGRVTGRTLAEIIAEINIHSNNYWAEALFRILGHDKASNKRTWAAAADNVAARLIADVGLKPADFGIVNGSGLYDATHISAHGMVTLLRHFHGDTPAAKAFSDSLAAAGVSGTLRHRLKELKGRLIGKTGTLDNAISLSGYLKRAEGCELAFASLVEGPIGDRAGRVRSAIDAWLKRLASL